MVLEEFLRSHIRTNHRFLWRKLPIRTFHNIGNDYHMLLFHIACNDIILVVYSKHTRC